MDESAARQPILSVVFYLSAAGNEPVSEWLLGLSRKDRTSVGFDIKTAQYGWPREEVPEDARNGLEDRETATRRPEAEVSTVDKKHVGGSFDDFLDEEGLLDEVEAVAAKRVIAFQIAQEMQRTNLTKSELARRMKTSRPAVERLLDPTNRSVTLSTLERAASAVGKKLKIELSA
jgi:antitoxin HicB